MSIKKINNYYLVDYESEIDLITDAKFGDKCHVIETATDYICNSQGKWFDTIPDSKQNGGETINQKYATEEFVMNQIAGIEIPEVNLENYATKKYVQEELSNIDIPEVDLSNYLPKDVVNAFYHPIKYEVTNLPKGSAVNYNDREIRIYCPEDVEYSHQ